MYTTPLCCTSGYQRVPAGTLGTLYTGYTIHWVHCTLGTLGTLYTGTLYARSHTVSTNELSGCSTRRPRIVPAHYTHAVIQCRPMSCQGCSTRRPRIVPAHYTHAVIQCRPMRRRRGLWSPAGRPVGGLGRGEVERVARRQGDNFWRRPHSPFFFSHTSFSSLETPSLLELRLSFTHAPPTTKKGN